MKQYAIKVPFEDSFLYVTCIESHEPLLFTSKSEAQERAEIWGPKAEAVEYVEPEFDED